ncbi:DUF3108 domain-containing protein [Salinarimonas soli]|uniref:DUF3108 domain-containing protein n=1 Tax=Salinarimonas soli TaxID=1638099 RepID=A0A5B2VCB7_9HYPH|nr:DUF3108 domain-containing protein [Salinarimonas soli]KAA2237103.1 DUF3108 domain-containing protein [Salinarimonas soli]
MRSSARLAAVLLALGATAFAPATAATFSADYGIYLAGLPIGEADVASTIEGDRYKLDVNAKLTGLVGLFVNGRGAATSTGSVSNGRVMPASFAVTSRNSSESRTVRMGLSSGNVAAVDITPPLDVKEDRVPVVDAHRRGIVDPVSALIMPMAAGEPLSPAQCARTIPVFDGASRFNIVLSYEGTRAVEKPGFKGDVLVCKVRWVPIAGHRPDKAAVKFMAENRNMSVWLAPLEGTRVLAPLRIAVETMVGMSVVEASRWELSPASTASVRRPVRAKN